MWCEQGGYYTPPSDSYCTVTFAHAFTRIPSVVMQRAKNSGSIAGNTTLVQIQTQYICNVTRTSFQTYGNAWSSSIGTNNIHFHASGY